MIRFENVSLCINNRMILKDLSFDVHAGETVLLVGSSGAGKSTILRLILRLLKPTSGRVLAMGQDINQISRKRLNTLRRQFSLVFQNGALFDSLTLAENIGFFLTENWQLPPEEVRARVLEITRFFGLHDFLDFMPAELSGGMRKRAAIARAIVTRPKVLLYDEPTAGLDPFAATRVVELIQRLQQEFEVTSLIVTHEIHHFISVVDKLLMLKNGLITYSGAPDLSILDHFQEAEAQERCLPEEEAYGNFQ